MFSNLSEQYEHPALPVRKLKWSNTEEEKWGIYLIMGDYPPTLMEAGKVPTDQTPSKINTKKTT